MIFEEIDRQLVQGRSLNNTEQLEDVPTGRVLHTMSRNVAQSRDLCYLLQGYRIQDVFKCLDHALFLCTGFSFEHQSGLEKKAKYKHGVSESQTLIFLSPFFF